MNIITVKAIIFWIIGALLLLTGSWIMGNLELIVGVNFGTYAAMILVSFILFLLSGVCWIYVSRRDLKK